MNITYLSAKSAKKIQPSETGLYICLTGTTEDPVYGTHPGWKNSITLKCEVLEPSGPDGSFAPMDNQAERIAKQLWPLLKDREGLTDICVQCEHGELRSLMVALSLFYFFEFTLARNASFCEYSEKSGQTKIEKLPHQGVFVSRSAAALQFTLENLEEGLPI